MQIHGIDPPAAGLNQRRLQQIRMVFLANAIAGRQRPEGPLDWARQPGGITYWEELGSVRLDPVRRRLEVLLLLKGRDGYSAGPDLPVTREYLRLFADPGDGCLVDAGLLELAVADCRAGAARAWACSRTRLSVELPRELGSPERVRAILSWQDVPPADDPEFRPVFGQRCDHHPETGAAGTPWLRVLRGHGGRGPGPARVAA